MLAAIVALTIFVPTIQSSDFKVGRTWIWDYVDESGKTYSTEQYKVLKQDGDMVLIEMSSAYRGNQNFKPQHRIEANIAECLAAYRNPVKKSPWSIKMYSLENGQWSAYQPPKTIAFEEKFNCNPHVQTDANADYLTAFKTIDGQNVFAQKLWRRLNGSWYSLDGANAGIALQKEFRYSVPPAYTMRRRP